MALSETFYVYLLFRRDGTPCYGGKGKRDRWKRHEGRTRHANLNLQRIIDAARAEGKELPKIKLACHLDEDAAFEIERLFIAAIGRKANGGPLVNLTDGGDGPTGYKPSRELIERQVAARKGWHQTDEHKAHMKALMTGRPKSPEHIAAVAAAQRGCKKSSGWWSTEEGRAKQRANNKGHTGHRHSPETIERIRAAAKLQQSRKISKIEADLPL